MILRYADAAEYDQDNAYEGSDHGQMSEIVYCTVPPVILKWEYSGEAEVGHRKQPEFSLACYQIKWYIRKVAF